MKKAPYIFWLASWYPTRLDPYPGDFIQRHAKALALYHPVHVLHIAKDENGSITKNIVIEETTSDNLRETLIYYHPPRTGLTLVDRMISHVSFIKVGKKFIRDKVASEPSVLMHVHVAMRHGLLAQWAKKTSGINYVITEHWTGYYREAYPKHLPSKFYWAAAKSIFKQASFFYPVVKLMGELINNTITVIPYKPVSNAVDTTLFYPAKEKMNVDETFQFIHVSTLSYQKNIEGLLRVMERCSLQNLPVHFTLVGPASGDVLKQVNSSTALLKVTTLTGALQYNEVAEQMRSAHALLMFSRYENQPCVILEALCCGLPVISTNVGGIAEVIDESNGILISNEDEEQLYNAIIAMLASYAYFNREQIAAKARQAFSYETIGMQLLTNYQHDMPAYF